MPPVDRGARFWRHCGVDFPFRQMLPCKRGTFTLPPPVNLYPYLTYSMDSQIFSLNKGYRVNLKHRDQQHLVLQAPSYWSTEVMHEDKLVV
jgi:hypothetical protein